MPLHTDITLDFNNMLAERIGAQGIELREIEEMIPTLNQTTRGLADLRKLGQLPFQDLPYQEESLETILSKAGEIRSRFEAVLLIGTGGSSLGASCLQDSLADSRREFRLEICEDLHPLTWDRLARTLPPDKTFLIVVSKSGKTVETLASFLFFREWLLRHVGEMRYRRSVLFITDPRQGPLRQIAEREKIETLPVPPGVGGRFSVLSTVGLLPAACVGVEVGALLQGARRMDERLKREEVWVNPAMMSAALHYLIERKKGRRIRVIMPYDSRLRGYVSWFAQLWSESLGKKLNLKGEEVRCGITPVRAEGSIDQHSQLQLYLEGPRDKSVTFIACERAGASLRVPESYPEHPELAELGGKAVDELLRVERLATEAALTDAGCPNLTLLMKEINPHTIGQLLYLSEVETVLTGALYDIHPFDQPGVEKIKNYIKGLLGAKGYDSYRSLLQNRKKDPRFMI